MILTYKSLSIENKWQLSMRVNNNIINFEIFISIYNKFGKTEKDRSIDIFPFVISLFSSNSAKQYVVFTKQKTIRRYLIQNPSVYNTLPFETIFGTFIPIPFYKFNNVMNIDTFNNQLTAGKDSVTFMKLHNKKENKIGNNGNLIQFDGINFHIIPITDELKHTLNYQCIVKEFKKVLKLDGLLNISHHLEHLIYSIFVRILIGHNEERVDVYHSSSDTAIVEKFIIKQFGALKQVNVFTCFISYLYGNSIYNLSRRWII